LSFRFALGGTDAESPFAALVMNADPPLTGFDRISFTATANHPMRMSVQLREPGGGEGQRWHRSVYVDETARSFTVLFADMTPIGHTRDAHPTLDRADAVLFVIDTVNARPGSNGQIWIDDVKYGR